MSNSFSIFNSDKIYELLPENISGKISQIGSLNFSEIFIPWIIYLFVFLVSAYLLRRNKNKLFHFGIYAILFYGLLRLILFENPVSWLAYRQILTWQEIGFREKAIIENSLRRYITPPQGIDYLALGSSQTGAIFSEYAKNNKNFYKIEFPGMGPIDYYLYFNLIKKIKPKVLILYLSEFDFGREIVEETMIYSSPQSLRKHYFLINTLKEKFGISKSLQISVKMLIADLLPEYKYQFLFRGLRDKLLNKQNLMKTKEQEFSNKSIKEIRKEQTHRLKISLNNKPVKLNFYIFEHFLTQLNKTDVNLVIIEGQYHPDAYSNNNLELNKNISSQIRILSEKYKFKYIRKIMYPKLEPADFSDGYHTNKSGSDKIINGVMPLINNDNKAK